MATPIFITVPTKYIPINVAPATTTTTAVAKPSTIRPLVVAKRPSPPPSSVASDDEESSSMDEYIVRGAGKKRRLDHLTWEEKIQRKKLKNRVAAQTSRDRKKAKMEEMEKTIQEQSEQIEQLQHRCTALDTEKSAIYDKYLNLERRFEDLQKRLEAQEQKVKEEPREEEETEIGGGTAAATAATNAVGGSVGCVTAGRTTTGSAAGTVQVRSGGSTNDTAPTSTGGERSAAGGPLEDHCPLPGLQELFEDFDVSQLEQLAESLLAGVDADLAGADQAGRPADAEGDRTGQCLSGSVVGPAAELLESGRPATDQGESRLILTTHNYCKSPFNEKQEQAQDKVAEEHNPTVTLTGDTLYGTYDNETNCITIVLRGTDEEMVVDETDLSQVQPTDVAGEATIEEEMPLFDQLDSSSPLGPITIRPPSPLPDRLLSPIAPALTQQPLKSPGGYSSMSDAGYESLGSPVAPTLSFDYALGDDFSEFWNLDPLFPILD